MDKIGLTRDLEGHILKGIPLSRLGQPDEVARLIAYLSTDDASFITGSEFFVDGGHSINR